MFFNSPYDEQAWELMASALQGDLSSEEAIEFRQWLELSSENRELFEQVMRVWSGMDAEEFRVFEQADDEEAWAGFQHVRRARRFRLGARRWMAAAAIFVLLLGAGWWYFAGRGIERTYETAAGEQRTVVLKDGSTVILQPQTVLRLASNFNVKDRTVVLVNGTARFDVVHRPEKTFTVETDAASIQDIGTSFTIEATRDSVSVSVTEGKVAFTQKSSGRTTVLAAGGKFCIYTDSLQFKNAPLSQVIAALERHSGRAIRLTDSSMGQKRLTINLNGESLEDALRVICASMHLEYTIRSGQYVLEREAPPR